MNSEPFLAIPTYIMLAIPRRRSIHFPARAFSRHILRHQVKRATCSTLAPTRTAIEFELAEVAAPAEGGAWPAMGEPPMRATSFFSGVVFTNRRAAAS